MEKKIEKTEAKKEDVKQSVRRLKQLRTSVKGGWNQNGASRAD